MTDNITRLLTRIANLPIGDKQFAVGDTEEYAFIEKAVEKATAKKINIIANKLGWDIPYCPCCHTNVQSQEDYSFAYCPVCGQKLDWVKEDKKPTDEEASKAEIETMTLFAHIGGRTLNGK